MNVTSLCRVGLAVSDRPVRARISAALTKSDSVRLDKLRPDVLVTGSDRDEITAAVESGAAVVAVLPLVDRRSTAEALDAGAQGIVNEAELDSAILVAVDAVHRGFIVVPLGARQAVCRPVLSSREKQILGMVVIGLTNAEIARRLFLAESTIKSHLSSIFGKLRVKSRKEAADLVLDPSSGLGTGILGLTPLDNEPTTAYNQPIVG
jgi:DNA-binding CsgD family transcriptional regulator